MLEIYFDGSYDHNGNNRASYGYVIYKNKSEIKNDYGVLDELFENGNRLNGNTTIVESAALEKALDYLITENIIDSLKVYSDNHGLVNMLNDNCCKSKIEIQRLFISRLKRKLLNFNGANNVVITRIRREQNSKADRLSRIPLKENNLNK